MLARIAGILKGFGRYDWLGTNHVGITASSCGLNPETQCRPVNADLSATTDVGNPAFCIFAGSPRLAPINGDVDGTRCEGETCFLGIAMVFLPLKVFHDVFVYSLTVVPNSRGSGD